jgi:hypothetical protein
MGGPLVQTIARVGSEELGDTLGRWLQSGGTRLAKEAGPLGEEFVSRLERFHGTWRQIAAPGLDAIEKNAAIPDNMKAAHMKLEVGTAKAIASVQHLGPKNSALKSLITAMGDDPKVGINTANHAWQTSMHFLGRPYPVRLQSGGPMQHTSKVPGLARSIAEDYTTYWNVLTKLSLAPMSHSVQPLNVPIMTGFGPAVRGLLDLVGNRQSAAKLKLESGAAVEDMLRRWNALANDEFMGKMTRFTMKPLNFLTDMYKSWATASAPYVLEDLSRTLSRNPTDKTALRRLATLDITPGSLLKGRTPAMTAQAASRLSDIAFPETNVLTVPTAWRDHSWHRMATMFKPFLFKQAKFLYDNVFKELAAGNVKPFLAMSMLYPTIAPLGSYLRGAAREGTTSPMQPSMDREHWADAVAWSMSQIGGLAIFSDVLGAFSAPSNTTQGFSFFFGPLAADIVSARDDVAHMGHAIAHGNPWLELDRQFKQEFLSRVPFVGPALSRQTRPRRIPQDYRGNLIRGELTQKVNKVLGINSRGDTEAPMAETP